MMVSFNLETFEMIFRRYLDHFMKFIKINVLFGADCGLIWAKNGRSMTLIIIPQDAFI